MAHRHAAALTLLGAALLGCRHPPAPPPQNVIFILLDTLRADHLSSYGYGRPTSPNLDAFARQHALFEQVRSQAPCTFPSVNSILTSRSPFRFLGQGRRRVGIPPELTTLGEILQRRGVRTGAISASSVVRKTKSEHNDFGGFDRGFDTFDEGCLHRNAECVNREARRFLNHTAEPFFLYLHYIDPHARYNPPSPFDGQFAPAAYDGPDWVRQGNPRPIYESLSGTGPKVAPSPADIQHLIDLYDGEIAHLDQELGKLLADLGRRGLLERTIVVIAADHGEEFLEHGQVWHCFNVFETSIRVPLILHVPGVRPGKPIGALVENLDLAPTILDYLRVPIPPDMEGSSLRPLLEGAAPAARLAFSAQSKLRSVTDGRFKLIHNIKTAEFALFDLAADPGESRDVLSRERPAFHRLRQELAAWLERIEGDVSEERRQELSEDARERLEALGYLK